MALSNMFNKKPVVIVLVLLVVAAIGGGAWWLLKPSPYEEGMQLAEEAKWDDALTAFQKQLEQDPKHQGSLYQSAKISLENKRNPNKALYFSKQLTASYPTYKEGNLVSGRINLTLGEMIPDISMKQKYLQSSQQLFSKVLDIEPSNQTALLGSGKTSYELWRLGDAEALPRAEKNLYDLVKLDPRNLDGHLYLAQIKVYMLDFTTARQQAEKALEINPQNDYANYLMGWALLYTGEKEKALVLAQKAAQELNRGAARNHHLLGVAFLANNNLVKAEISLKQARNSEPSNMIFNRDYVRILRLLDKTQEARDTLESIRSNTQGGLDPDLFVMALYSVLYQMGEKDEASRILKEFAEANPNSLEALLELASSMYESRNTVEALEAFKKVINLNSKDATACYNIGTIELKQSSFVGAEQHLKRAVAINPAFPEAHLNLGNVYYLTRRWDEARAAYNDAAAQDPQSALVLNNLGLVEQEVYDEGGDKQYLEKAAAFFKQAYELDPGFQEPMVNHALLLSGQLRYSEAIDLLDKAIELSVTQTPTVALLCKAYINLARKDYDASVRDYQRVSDDGQLLKEQNLAIIGKAINLYFQKRYTDALLELEKIPERARSYPWAIMNKVMIQMKMKGPTPDLRPMLKEALTIDDIAEGRALLALLELLSGNLNEAEKECRNAIELDNALTGTHYNYGVTLDQLGRYQEAEGMYEKELVLNPAFLPASINRGLNLMLQENFDKAIEVLQKAETKGASNAALQTAIASVYFRQKKYTKAREYAQNSLAQDSKLADTHALLCVIAIRVDDYETAEKHALEAVKLNPLLFHAWLNLTGVQLRLEKYREAQNSLDKAAGLVGGDSSRNLDYLHMRISSRISKGLLDLALVDIDKVVKISGGNEILSNLRAKIVELGSRR
jgi:tetratricopeptide (TPR) repeat protein